MNELLGLLKKADIGDILKGSASLYGAVSSNNIQKEMLSQSKQQLDANLQVYEDNREDREERKKYKWAEGLT